MIKFTQNELNELIDNKGKQLNLYDCDLSYLSLLDVDLSGANFTNCKLHNVIFKYSNLTYCNFINCDFSYSNFSKCNLTMSQIKNCKLDGANFSGANLSEVRGIRQYSVDNVGTFDGKITYLVNQDMVYAGCWKGTFEEFKLKCKDVILKNKSHLPNIKNELKATIEFFKTVANY